MFVIFFIVPLIKLKYVLLYFLLLPKVMEKYIVPDYVNVQEFLAHLGKRLGKLKKGKVLLKGKMNCVILGSVVQKLITQNQETEENLLTSLKN